MGNSVSSHGSRHRGGSSSAEEEEEELASRRRRLGGGGSSMSELGRSFLVTAMEEDLERSAIPSADDKPEGKRAGWTEEEDNALRELVDKYGGKNWRGIAHALGTGRSHVQCLQRWAKVLRPGLIKGPWSPEQDEILRAAVQASPPGDWPAIAAFVPGRTPKQCRERWFLGLDPGIKHDPWTEEEDALLLSKYDELGSKWATISHLLPGRTENACKSRYKSLERRAEKAWQPEEDALIIRLRSQGVGWDEMVGQLRNRSRHGIRMRYKALEAEGRAVRPPPASKRKPAPPRPALNDHPSPNTTFVRPNASSNLYAAPSISPERAPQESAPLAVAHAMLPPSAAPTQRFRSGNSLRRAGSSGTSVSSEFAKKGLSAKRISSDKFVPPSNFSMDTSVFLDQVFEEMEQQQQQQQHESWGGGGSLSSLPPLLSPYYGGSGRLPFRGLSPTAGAGISPKWQSDFSSANCFLAPPSHAWRETAARRGSSGLASTGDNGEFDSLDFEIT